MALQRITATAADRACFLLLGPAGCGKTSQIRCLLGEDYRKGRWSPTEIRPEKVLVLSAESGLLCVRDLVASGAVEGFEIKSLADFNDALRYCQGPEFREAGYQWVFIDSLTEIAARCVEEMQRRYPSKGDSYNLWNDYTTTMTTIIKAYRDMPRVNVVFTCLLCADKDDVGRRFLTPDISGNGLKKRLTSYFDEVLLMGEETVDETGRTARAFRTKYLNGQTGLAKDRSGLLREIEYPNLLMVRNRIIGETKES